MRIDFDKCKNILNNANNIALFCHTRPDGDTLGAALALKLALSKKGKTVKIFCDEKVPSKFLNFGFDKHFHIELKEKIKNFDLYVAIDCGDLGRLGAFYNKFINNKNTLAIDHHITHEDFCENTFVLGYSSTCEIVLKIITDMNIPLDKEIATALFVGLSTDTGNFKHSNTNENSFLCARQLISFGIDIAEINRKLYNETSYIRLKLLGKSLSNMRRYFDGKLCIMYVTEKDFKDCNADITYTEGFTDYAISVDTAQIGVCISQNNANSFKISMRSKKLDVSEICKFFGGGGHKQASGCVLCGFLEDVIDKIVRAVEDLQWTDS